MTSIKHPDNTLLTGQEAACKNNKENKIFLSAI
jgi:hypothetical protein